MVIKTVNVMSHAHDDAASKPLGPIAWLLILIGTAIMGYLVYYNIVHLHDAHHGGSDEAPPWWGIGVLPFVALLGCIAVLPLLPATHHWWESNRNRLIIALLCAGFTLVYYFLTHGAASILPVLNHAVPGEYIPFIVLLFSLYVISGGISLKGDLAAHPITNTAFLAIGAGIASFIGTTGASMLLIRPLLQTNSERKHVVHTVIFFIFLVSNIGGTLLPIGDPPLFLGYLRGVDFFWTFNLWIEWATCCAILLVMYYVIDTIAYKREGVFDIKKDETRKQPLRLRGIINILWLAGVVACVATVNHETTLINKPLAEGNTIAELNGGRGAHLESLYIADSAGHETMIDLHDAATIGEVVDRINADAHVSVTAALEGDSLTITDQADGEHPLTILDHEPPDDTPHANDDEHATERDDAPAHADDDHDAHGAHHTAETAKALGIRGTFADGAAIGSAINPGWTPFPFLREVLMFVLVGLSLFSTPRGIREDNQFNYAAILEVAALFIGIFIAMQVPIEVLKVYGNQLGLEQPWHFYWATGSLSSFLDNAPTYVVFFETASSLSAEEYPGTIIPPELLMGISLGAVFMGAMTYIGNGPNFMVKAIAEQSGVRMPSFFGYMFKFSIPILIPVFVLITILFLRGGGHHGDAQTHAPDSDTQAVTQVDPDAQSPGPGH
jgi:Na+/H+ antiporter NhaD/arsenite permease-like protein